MKCTWHDETDCQEEAIEKWTEILYIDPYCGPFYASDKEVPPPRIEYACASHSQITRDIYLETCKGDVSKANRYLSDTFRIEKL